VPNRQKDQQGLRLPADTGASRILRDENLLKAAGRIFRKVFRARAKPDQKLRHVVGLREAAATEIVAPPNETVRRLPVKPWNSNSLKGRLSASRRAFSFSALSKSA
jgi:hypothetical protein